MLPKQHVAATLSVCVCLCVCDREEGADVDVTEESMNKRKMGLQMRGAHDR